MKKKLLSFMILTVLSITLIGCSSSTNTVSQADISQLNNNNQIQNADDIIAQYEQEQTNQQIENEEKKESLPKAVSSNNVVVFSGDNPIIDVDVSVLSQTMMIAEINAILMDPDSYMGKTIRIAGKYNQYDAREEFGKIYHYVYLMDEGGCCPVAVEFVSDTTSEYPKQDQPIEVTGVLKEYSETYAGQEFTYYYLEVA